MNDPRPSAASRLAMARSHAERLYRSHRLRRTALIVAIVLAVFGLAQHITVLDQGRVLAEGAPAEISANERVRAAYLGEEAA